VYLRQNLFQNTRRRQNKDVACRFQENNVAVINQISRRSLLFSYWKQIRIYFYFTNNHPHRLMIINNSVKYVTFIIDSIYLYIQFAFHFKISPKQKQGKNELRIKCLLLGYLKLLDFITVSSTCHLVLHGHLWFAYLLV
jgi:hypothetical protein